MKDLGRLPQLYEVTKQYDYLIIYISIRSKCKVEVPILNDAKRFF